MTLMERWQLIKSQYSQSGIFDLAGPLEEYLDKDIMELLEKAKIEGAERHTLYTEARRWGPSYDKGC